MIRIEESEADVSCCASCGIAEIDDIKSMSCDGCNLVKYCSDECMEDHKSEHKEDCKKLAAELRDELLFKQPESTHFGDCPICSLPIPFDGKKFVLNSCCSKFICKGCSYANRMREIELRQNATCPFCRERMPRTTEEAHTQNMKRIEANDPIAICKRGVEQYNKKEYICALEYFTKAAALGSIEAHARLAHLYQHEEGVEKDEGKRVYHLEEAAIGGHPLARYNLGRHELEKYRLGRHELENGTLERAMKHWIIAATQGYDAAIKGLMGAFKDGFLKKEVLAATLRAHKAAVDATKSPQREAVGE